MKHFPIRKGLLQRQVGAVQAVDGVTFGVRRQETFSIVGESGCGKSTTGRLLTRLLEPTAGRIVLEGRDITHLSDAAMRPLRRDVQMIFQDPYSSLNPRHTVGTIVGAPFRLQNVSPDGGVKRAVQDLLEAVGLNPEHYNRYPHEFSGGQRQRIGIARTLALRPRLIVADEPVSALDVSIQAQIINLLEDLQSEFKLTYVMIAHDLSVVRHVSDRVAVMYLGKIVELADRDALYATPMHPYTTALMSAVPVPNTRGREQRERIRLIGDVPSPINPPPACRFHTRCWKAQDICRTTEPPLVALAPGHEVACHFPENQPGDAPHRAVAAMTGPTYFDAYDTQVGVVGVVARSDGVLRTGWGLRPDGASTEPDAMVQRALGQLREYFAGQRRTFDLPLLLPDAGPHHPCRADHTGHDRRVRGDDHLRGAGPAQRHGSAGPGHRVGAGRQPAADPDPVPPGGGRRRPRWLLRRRPRTRAGDQAVAAGERGRAAPAAGLSPATEGYPGGGEPAGERSSRDSYEIGAWSGPGVLSWGGPRVGEPVGGPTRRSGSLSTRA